MRSWKGKFWWWTLIFIPLSYCFPEITTRRFQSADTKCKSHELYNQADGRCYLEGLQGPCGSKMIFVQDAITTSSDLKNSYLKVGKCDCELAESQFPCKHLPVLYSERNNRCYEMYTQGPCATGKWWTLAASTFESLPIVTPVRGACKPNPCQNLSHGTQSPANTTLRRSYLFNGTCYQTQTRGHCLDPDHVSYFTGNNPLPFCGEYDQVYGNCTKALRCLEDELYHEASAKCYKQYSRGPCSETMVLRHVDLTRSKSYMKQFGEQVWFGKCDCQLSGHRRDCSRRPYLYSPSTQRCFPAFSRGPCKDAEWFRPHPNEEYPSNSRLRQGFCMPNDCENSESIPDKNNLRREGNRVFYHGSDNGKCYLTGTRGRCTNLDQISYFDRESTHPQCTTKIIFLFYYPKCLPPDPLPNLQNGTTICPKNFSLRGQECIGELNLT